MKSFGNDYQVRKDIKNSYWEFKPPVEERIQFCDDNLDEYLDDGKKIKTAINNLGGTAVANIKPICNYVAVKTILRITKLSYFEWSIKDLDELPKVETGEIQQNDIPAIKTVEARITRYADSLRREAAEQRVAENSNSNNEQGKNNNEICQSELSNILKINKTIRKHLGDISNNININKRQKN
ncbi:hypothetical protein Glove_130g23 [Diversispora epigaea]|uniref:Uncharacterized protein n=1 Tax=Diversispora epigaea TaxID=1348612 RepID=A0A397IY98_9GLOM|nr:hypothetical protein Glove_130g23 [Diversispora epigaea]